MKSEIMSVGTELLLGQLVDTNAPYLAESLSNLGIDVYWISQVGDNQERMTQALRRGWDRSDLIVISGGLGPTEDDLTREAIADLLGEQMEVKPDLEAELRAFFVRRGRSMPERNVKQATLIPSAQAIPNPIGTAPGWWVQRDGRIIVAMPGVPVEMKRMWEQMVVPRLARAAGSGIIFSRTLKILGLGESWVEDELRELTHSSNPTLATYAKQDGIHVRVTAKAENQEDASRMVAAVEAEVRRILGEHVYGVDDETVSDAVGRLLAKCGTTLGVMESCTFGELSSSLGSSLEGRQQLVGALVAPDEGLLRHFGVEPEMIATHGMLSEETVGAMATAARAHLKTDLGLAVVCGMEGGQESGQRFGVACCGVHGPRGIAATTNRYTTTERDLRRRAVLDAMDLLRRLLLADCQD